jgi:hypothetical protein
MKKITFLFTLLMVCSFTTAQNLSYGPLLGFNAYDVEIDGPVSGGSGFSRLNFGGFIDYRLNDHLGVKGNLLYSDVTEDNYYVVNGNVIEGYLFDQSRIKTLHLHTLLKFDVNKSYNKGFYLIGGFRATNVLDAKFDGEKNDDFYKKTHLGGMLGFGVNFAKHFGFEFIPDVNLTNTLDSDNNKARNFGMFINLTANIDSMIK